MTKKKFISVVWTVARRLVVVMALTQGALIKGQYVILEKKFKHRVLIFTTHKYLFFQKKLFSEGEEVPLNNV